MAKNLVGKLLEEMNRVREIIKEYEKYPNTEIAVMMMKNDIEHAEDALENHNVGKMITSLTNLQGYHL